MNLKKVLRNRVLLIANRIRTKYGEQKFFEAINRDWTRSYEEVQSIWNKSETKVHFEVTEAGYKEMSECIAEELCLRKEDNVLDIGCGDGHIDYYLKEKCGHLSGFDFSKTKIEEAKNRNKDVSYFSASFLEDYKEKCQNINKVFAYGVMQFCKPEDVSTFIRRSVEVLGEDGEMVIYFDIPDKDKMAVYYSIKFGVPIETVNRMKDDIIYIFSDGSYWHDMKKMKKECESVLKELWGESGTWQVTLENAKCYYRSNLRIERKRRNEDYGGGMV